MSTGAHLTPDVHRSAGLPEYEVLLLSHPEDPGYAAVCPTLGCASQGDTREEALEMVAAAIALCLDRSAGDGQEVPYDPDATSSVLEGYASDGCSIEKAVVRPVDWDAIIACCDDAVLRDPANSKIFLERGNAYLNKGEDDRAIADYDVAISLDPGYAEAYGRRGDAHFNKRDYDQAIADYDAALRRDPYDLAVFSGLEAAYVGLWENGPGA